MTFSQILQPNFLYRANNISSCKRIFLFLRISALHNIAPFFIKNTTLFYLPHNYLQHYWKPKVLFSKTSIANRSRPQTVPITVIQSDKKYLKSFSTSHNIHNKRKKKLIALLNGKWSRTIHPFIKGVQTFNPELKITPEIPELITLRKEHCAVYIICILTFLLLIF